MFIAAASAAAAAAIATAAEGSWTVGPAAPSQEVAWLIVCDDHSFFVLFFKPIWGLLFGGI